MKSFPQTLLTISIVTLAFIGCSSQTGVTPTEETSLDENTTVSETDTLDQQNKADDDGWDAPWGHNG